MKKRIEWIDIVKGIGILTIIISHTGFLPFSTILSPLTTSWPLPLFAFVGGYVFKVEKSFLFYLRKKFRRLIVPYILAGSLSFILWLYLREVYPQHKILFSAQTEFIHFLLVKNLIFNGPLWFLPAYFLSSLAVFLFYPIWKKLHTAGKILGIGLGISLATTFVGFKTDFPFSFDISFIFVSFSYIGILWREKKIPWRRLYFIFAFLLFSITSCLNGTVDLYGRILHNPFLFWISSISGVLLATEGSRIIQRVNILKRFLLYSGRHSLLLLVIQWPVIQWTSFVLKITGVADRLGMNPTETSYWLPHMDGGVTRIFVFGFLFVYLLTIYLVCFCLERL